MGIAFVAFTTQFGGGFASSAQIYQYFINYGLRMRSAVWPAARCRPSPRRTARSVRRSGWRCCISSSSSRRSRSCISTWSRSRTSSRSTAQPSACLSLQLRSDGAFHHRPAGDCLCGRSCNASVPMLVLIQNGVGAGVLTPIISILIILGSISTAVNMISGIVTRCVNAVERGRKSDAERMKGHLARNAVFTSYLHLYRVRHHAVRSDGRGQAGLCISRLCGAHHAVYPVRTARAHHAGQRNLNIAFNRIGNLIRFCFFAHAARASTCLGSACRRRRRGRTHDPAEARCAADNLRPRAG